MEAAPYWTPAKLDSQYDSWCSGRDDYDKDAPQEVKLEQYIDELIKNEKYGSAVQWIINRDVPGGEGVINGIKDFTVAEHIAVVKAFRKTISNNDKLERVMFFDLVEEGIFITYDPEELRRLSEKQSASQ